MCQLAPFNSSDTHSTNCHSLQTEVLYLLDNVALSSEVLCGIVKFNACKTADDPFPMWNVTFPSIPKPPVAPLPTPPVSANLCFILNGKQLSLCYLFLNQCDIMVNDTL